ncbi:MAG: hypothetical protein RLZZ248_722 [Bacteroidota bacterium]
MNFRKIGFWEIAVIGLALLSCNRQEVTIQGLAEGMDGVEVRLAKLNLKDNTTVYLDTTQIVDGQFQFTLDRSAPYLHALVVRDTVKHNFFLEEVDILLEIESSGDTFEWTTLQSGKEDQLFQTIDIDSIFERSSGQAIMESYPDYVFAVFTAYYQFQLHPYSVEEMEAFLNRFSTYAKASEYYAAILPLVERIKNTAIGVEAPHFEAPDTSGQVQSLSDFKGKFVLLDFWASWCAPCRVENPKLLTFYQKTNRQKFEILGISVDESEGRWKRAILQDQLPWPNVSLLSGWSVISELYGVKAVPQNYLINPEGIIAGKNLSIEALEKMDFF